MPTRTARAFLIGLAALTLGVAACKGSSNDSGPSGTGTPTASGSATASPKTFSGNGVSFDYPKDWQEFTLTGTSAQAGSSLWNETVGLDPINFVNVAGYTIGKEITSGNIAAQKDGLASQIQQLFVRAGGSMTGGPTDETMAGLPALGFTGTAKNPSGATVNSRLVLAFDGTTEYFVNCQYDDTGKTSILAGCDQIVSTFSLG